ncbi:MAG TPA: hypothetical protein VFS05_07370 [Gemmatimonadaceae bacterium]|nr:hypothetical protein [Gemmatimonadaceae bacterium]
MIRTSRKIAVVVGGLILAAFGCREAATGPRATAPVLHDIDSTATTVVTSAQLLVCPADTTLTTSGIIGPLGGTLQVGGASITLPPGAVLAPTPFTLTVPASRYMEVEIHAGDAEHFVFVIPATIAISYARCQGEVTAASPLRAWYIDSVTNALLELMGGQDDRAARRVTFTTGHLSGYAIAQ